MLPGQCNTSSIKKTVDKAYLSVCETDELMVLLSSQKSQKSFLCEKYLNNFLNIFNDNTFETITASVFNDISVNVTTAKLYIQPIEQNICNILNEIEHRNNISEGKITLSQRRLSKLNLLIDNNTTEYNTDSLRRSYQSSTTTSDNEITKKTSNSNFITVHEPHDDRYSPTQANNIQKIFHSRSISEPCGEETVELTRRQKKRMSDRQERINRIYSTKNDMLKRNYRLSRAEEHYEKHISVQNKKVSLTLSKNIFQRLKNRYKKKAN